MYLIIQRVRHQTNRNFIIINLAPQLLWLYFWLLTVHKELPFVSSRAEVRSWSPDWHLLAFCSVISRQCECFRLYLLMSVLVSSGLRIRIGARASVCVHQSGASGDIGGPRRVLAWRHSYLLEATCLQLCSISERRRCCICVRFFV